jgi:hypothetical protein
VTDPEPDVYAHNYVGMYVCMYEEWSARGSEVAQPESNAYTQYVCVSMHV